MRSGSPLTKSFGVMFGGIWLIVGVPFFVAGVYAAIHQKIEQKRLNESGQRADGIVLTKSYSSGDSQTFSVTYRFLTDTGSIVKAKASIAGGVWDALAEQGPIEVTYLPQRPSAARVHGQTTDTLLSLIFTIVGGILTAIGGYIFASGLRKARRES